MFGETKKAKAGSLNRIFNSKSAAYESKFAHWLQIFFPLCVIADASNYFAHIGT